MGRKRGRASVDSIVGTYEISTGTAEIVADDIIDGAYLLKVNGVLSSHIVPGDPEILVFEYMRWVAAFVEDFVEGRIEPAQLRVTHLGGAACSLARYFSDLWPESRHTVVELDAKLAEYVREWFDIPRAPKVKIRAGEAGAVTRSFAPDSRDVIIRDVFSVDETPEELASTEFFRDVHRSLAPGGLYISNCGDHPDLLGARAELAGMKEVFAHRGVIADPPMLKGRRRGNIILIGSDSPLPAEDSPESAQLTRKLLGGGVPAQYHDEMWVRRNL